MRRPPSKARPTAARHYDDLLKVLYELFLLGRRNGMIAVEEHVLEPDKSPVFKKYPRFCRQARRRTSLRRAAPHC